MNNATNSSGGGNGAKPLWDSCERFQKQAPVVYPLCMAIYTTLFVGGLILMLSNLYKHLSTQKRFTVDLKVSTWSLTACGSIVRLIWCLDPHPHSSWLGGHLWRDTNAGIGINAVLLRLAQVFWLSAIMLVMLVWKELVDSTTKMKRRVKGSGLQKTHKLVALFFSAFMLTVMPFTLLTGFFPPESKGETLFKMLATNIIG